ncbi:hypothetical protein [Streptomyces sp. NPDC001787]|uniref:hypothetical protein n=1 Tax=Streptomyces sp. NPDC001787 TaxID=3154523 RepID=UPI0033291499
MTAKDELALRRYEHLVDRLEGLLRASLKPEYTGYYGQLILSAERLEELGDLKDVRLAAREAGSRLGWKTITRLVGGQLFPALFVSVSRCLDDPDPHVREAAISACIPLLDDPLLFSHRTELAPLLRRTLAVSARWQHRDRAIEALARWGEETAELEVRREAFEVCAAERRDARDWSTEPPLLTDYTSAPPF